MGNTLQEKFQKALEDVTGLGDKLEPVNESIDIVNAELAGKCTDKQKASKLKRLAGLRDKKEKLQVRLDKKVMETKELERKIKLQKALSERAMLDEEITSLQLASFVSEGGDLDESSARDFVTSARKVQRGQDALAVLREPLDEAKNFLRGFVAANTTGWLDNTDPYKRYRFTRAGKIMVILQDGVNYEITLSELLKISTVEHLIELGLLKVDNVKLVAEIEKGKFMISDHKIRQIRPMTIEEWENIRERNLKAPTVVVREEDAVGDEKVVVIKPELLALPVDKLPEMTQLNMHHVNRLVENGIQIIGQLKGMSVVDLIDIAGIGRVRAGEIIDEVTNKLG